MVARFVPYEADVDVVFVVVTEAEDGPVGLGGWLEADMSFWLIDSLADESV